jgi:hypothetical protein
VGTRNSQNNIEIRKKRRQFLKMSYEPDFRPTDMSDIGSMVGAFQSARIRENADYAVRLAKLQADQKARLELKKEVLFKISKIVEEIPDMLKSNHVEGIMWINKLPDYMRENGIDSSAFDTLDFKELAQKTWNRLDELEKYCLTNLPDAVIAFEKAKALIEEDKKRQKEREERIGPAVGTPNGIKVLLILLLVGFACFLLYFLASAF